MFFDNKIPLENIVTTNSFIKFLSKEIPLGKNILIVSPNSESLQKARNYQIDLKKEFPDSDIKVAAFFQNNSSSGHINIDDLQLLGNPKVLFINNLYTFILYSLIYIYIFI